MLLERGIHLNGKQYRSQPLTTLIYRYEYNYQEYFGAVSKTVTKSVALIFLTNIWARMWINNPTWPPSIFTQSSLAS